MKKKVNDSDGDVEKERPEQAGRDAFVIRDAQLHSEKAFQQTDREERETAAHCNESDDSEVPQSPDLETARLEARRRVQERILAERNSRSSRPLQGLVGAENEIQARAEAAVILSNPKPRVLDKTLLTHQLRRTIIGGSQSSDQELRDQELRNDTIRLYTALESKDPTESIYNRLRVMMLNNVAECHARAARASNPKAIDVNLRYAVAGTRAIIDLTEAVERRRDPKQVTISKVNVEAGGQAMVGNFQTQRKAEHRKRKKTPDSGDGSEE